MILRMFTLFTTTMYLFHIDQKNTVSVPLFRITVPAFSKSAKMMTSYVNTPGDVDSKIYDAPVRSLSVRRNRK